MKTIRVDLTPSHTTFPPGRVSVGDKLVMVQLGGPKDGHVYCTAIVRELSPGGRLTFEVTEPGLGVTAFKEGDVHTIIFNEGEDC